MEDGGDIAARRYGRRSQRVCPVRGARIVFADGKSDMKLQGADFVGTSVTGDTSYYIELVVPTARLTRVERIRRNNLEDQPPTLTSPAEQEATNLEEVFTQARAEDDYGVVSMDSLLREW